MGLLIPAYQPPWLVVRKRRRGAWKCLSGVRHCACASCSVCVVQLLLRVVVMMMMIVNMLRTLTSVHVVNFTCMILMHKQAVE